MKVKIKPTARFEGAIDSVSIHEVISLRVWWKPWTWRRKLYLEYNPVLHPCYPGREIESPRPDISSDWEGKQWVVTDNKKFRRLIYRDYITPESLYGLGFHGNEDDIIIFPYDDGNK